MKIRKRMKKVTASDTNRLVDNSPEQFVEVDRLRELNDNNY